MCSARGHRAVGLCEQANVRRPQDTDKQFSASTEYAPPWGSSYRLGVLVAFLLSSILRIQLLTRKEYEKKTHSLCRVTPGDFNE